jgi:hypothetical protein
MLVQFWLGYVRLDKAIEGYVNFGIEITIVLSFLNVFFSMLLNN